MTLTTVVFDLGETLVDETSLWQGWADLLDVPPFTLFGILGGLAATNRDHREFLEVLGVSGEGPSWQLSPADLYPDAIACLQACRDDGWHVVVGGNQPQQFQRLVEELGLPVDLVTSSGELGVAKPERGFYEGIAAKAGTTPSQCVHVGDRVDNDVVGAQEAGMTAVHVVRGPWGFLHAGDPAITHQVPDLASLPALLKDLR